jgi:hypothetical protein
MKPETTFTYYKVEQMCVNGKHQQLDRPAYQSWYENGQKYCQQWYINGIFHRVGGPAYLAWNQNGQICTEEWFIKGVNKTDEILKWIKDNKIELDENRCIVNRNDLVLFKLKWG